MHLLKTHYDISFSERTLKRSLQKYNLRKNSNTGDSVLRIIIKKGIRDPITVSRIQRNVAKKIIQYPSALDRVMQIIREEDTEGTAQRRSHKLVLRDYISFDSNFGWHCDNYDKLKPYGLPIYGAVDDFSHKVIW